MRRTIAEGRGDNSMDDDELQELVSWRIESDPAFWVGQYTPRSMVVVNVEDGIVTLSGIVRSPRERRLADILARSLGAIGVENRLRVANDIDWTH